MENGESVERYVFTLTAVIESKSVMPRSVATHTKVFTNRIARTGLSSASILLQAHF